MKIQFQQIYHIRYLHQRHLNYLFCIKATGNLFSLDASKLNPVISDPSIRDYNNKFTPNIGLVSTCTLIKHMLVYQYLILLNLIDTMTMR
jgi:hypothetical protein